MINISDKKNCSGCGSCANICPHHCIEMMPDDEGFLYPKVDASKCIACGLCDKACPVKNSFVKRNPIESFAIMHKLDKVRKKSSSGGAFPALFLEAMKRNGVVCGVEFDSNFETHHICVDKREKLDELIGSKYIQSRTEKCYSEIGAYLISKKFVLFVGTPCQVAGLAKYLQVKKINTDNLMNIELCCHGVPSPGIWRQYLKELNILPSQISSLTFRSKVNGVNNYTLVINTPDGEILSESKNKNSYMRGFLNNLYCRPICSQCPFRQFATNSDLSIGDFWALNKFYPEKNDGKGCNQVLLNTPKGKRFFESLDLCQYDKFPITLGESYFGNLNYIASSPFHPKRDKFWDMIRHGSKVSVAVEKSLNDTSIIKKILRKLWVRLH